MYRFIKKCCPLFILLFIFAAADLSVLATDADARARGGGACRPSRDDGRLPALGAAGAGEMAGHTGPDSGGCIGYYAGRYYETILHPVAGGSGDGSRPLPVVT